MRRMGKPRHAHAAAPPSSASSPCAEHGGCIVRLNGNVDASSDS